MLMHNLFLFLLHKLMTFSHMAQQSDSTNTQCVGFTPCSECKMSWGQNQLANCMSRSCWAQRPTGTVEWMSLLHYNKIFFISETTSLSATGTSWGHWLFKPFQFSWGKLTVRDLMENSRQSSWQKNFGGVRSLFSRLKLHNVWAHYITDVSNSGQSSFSKAGRSPGYINYLKSHYWQNVFFEFLSFQRTFQTKAYSLVKYVQFSRKGPLSEH